MFNISQSELLKSVKLLVTGFLIIALISCASTTTVRVLDESGSIDRDVKIYLDGSYSGKGEIMYSDTKIVGSTTNVTLRKKGCRNSMYSLSRSEQLQVGALIGGLFSLIPLLWVMGYNPMHSYEFICEKN